MTNSRAAGFTLLELLIVLVLIGFMAAMVGPRLQRTFDAIAGSGERAEVVRQIERLPLLARDQGAAIEIPAGDSAALGRRLALPEGWSLEPMQPVRVQANGLCHATVLRVSGRGVTEDWPVAAPDCAVTDAL